MTDAPNPTTQVIYNAETARACNGCSACCKLLPTKELNKPANTRCPHQRFSKGCTIYAKRPVSCRYWSCRWLLGLDTADLGRPDRSHYVIDPLPDFIRIRNNVDNELIANVEVVQIWNDPAYPDAHRDPALRRYLLRRAEENIAAIVRYGSKDGFVLLPPTMTAEKQWRECRSNTMREQEHSLQEFLDAKIENDELQRKREQP